MNNSVILIFLLLLTHLATGQNPVVRESEGMSYVVEEITKDLDDVPWGMVFIQPGELFITRRSGSAVILNVDTGKITPVSGVPDVMAGGQGGLLDIALPPGHTSADWIYFSYTKKIGNEGATTLARAKCLCVSLVDMVTSRSCRSTS